MAAPAPPAAVGVAHPALPPAALRAALRARNLDVEAQPDVRALERDDGGLHDRQQVLRLRPTDHRAYRRGGDAASDSAVVPTAAV